MSKEAQNNLCLLIKQGVEKVWGYFIVEENYLQKYKLSQEDLRINWEQKPVSIKGHSAVQGCKKARECSLL